MVKETLPWKSCFRDNLFLKKVALVSGGGTGIGRAITTELASLGATVVIASRDTEKCELAANEINQLLKRNTSSKGRVVVGPSTNVRDEEDIKSLVSRALARCVVSILKVQFDTSPQIAFFNGSIPPHYRLLISWKDMDHWTFW